VTKITSRLLCTAITGKSSTGVAPVDRGGARNLFWGGIKVFGEV